MSRFSVAELTQLATGVLEKAGAAPAMAQAAAKALVAAEMEGLAGHGLSRAPLYAQHLREGRVNGQAKVSIKTDKGATCLIDAGGGLAFEASALAVNEAIKRARRFGVAFCGVTNSHHFGAAAYHLAPVAQAGMVGLAFTNSPAAINAWGGKKPLFGTNPIAAIFPRRAMRADSLSASDCTANEAGRGEPLIIDLSLTEVVRGKIMLYAKEGKPIPLGWAVDKDGKPTTDAKAALTGSLFAIGGAKGAMLALAVELLCVTLTGAAFGYENDSYFEPGNKPRIGHAIVAIDPAALAGSETYFERVETLVTAMLIDEGVRLPGERRHAARIDARERGIELPDSVYRQLVALAASRAKPPA
jgi:(2R)-3-sulfolactate dehydrogenase (NADP+)